MQCTKSDVKPDRQALWKDRTQHWLKSFPSLKALCQNDTIWSGWTKQAQLEKKGSWHQNSLLCSACSILLCINLSANLIAIQITHSAHTLFRLEAKVYGTLRSAAETWVTFSIVAGHFERAMNPSQRTGVMGDFLKPAQCFSDLPPGHCNVCTLHLFSCVLLHSCISFFGLLMLMLLNVNI